MTYLIAYASTIALLDRKQQSSVTLLSSGSAIDSAKRKGSYRKDIRKDIDMNSTIDNIEDDLDVNTRWVIHHPNNVK